MKIAYITTGNPFDKNSWSGTDFYARKALEDQGCTVYCIYGYKYYNLSIVLKKVWAKIFKKNYQAIRNLSVSKKWAKYITSHLEEGTDAILSMSTIPVACLKSNIPIYIYIDGIYEFMLKQGFVKNSNNINEAHKIEDMAIQKCTKIITSSNASAETIANIYHKANGKIEVVPFGANLDIYPNRDEMIKHISNKNFEKCKILFVGVDWERKGAQLVIDTVKILHNQGFPIELHLVGLKKIPVELEPYVINHGFISKMSPDGTDKLYSLYLECHFLFVPSSAEAYGLVFCEASAFGVPSISNTIGGIPTIIQNNVNGQLFKKGTSAEVYANYIKETFNKTQEYKNLATTTVKRFHESLNWNTAGNKLITIIKETIRQKVLIQ